MYEPLRYVQFLIDNSLEQDEFLLLYLLYRHSKGDKDATKAILLWTQMRGKVQPNTNQLTMTSKEVKDKLVKEGWMTHVAEGQYKISEKFTQHFVDAWEAIDELCDNYPAYAMIDGKRIPLKIADLTELKDVYWKLIKGLVTEHKEVLLDVTYGMANELITMNIQNFVKSKFWTSLRRMRIQNTFINTHVVNEDF